ncbi:kelch-like protein 10 [Lycodopsis pacificus]
MGVVQTCCDFLGEQLCPENCIGIFQAYHGTAVLDGSIYCVGGFNRVERFNSVRRFDVNMGTWHEGPPIPHRVKYRLFIAT